MPFTLHLPRDLTHSPLRILVVGAGGTGSQVLTGLARIHTALVALGRRDGLHVTCCDPDTVSTANVGRQLFSPADVGAPKASVLIQRLNLFHGLAWNAHACALAGMPADSFSRFSLVIGCVDTAAARREIAACRQHLGDWWLDLGNDARTAQVILGTRTCQAHLSPCTAEGALLPIQNSKFKTQNVPEVHLRDYPAKYPESKGIASATIRIPNVLDLFPKLASKTYRENNTPSCSLAEAVRKQDLFINQAASTFALDLLWQWLRHGRLTRHGAFINLESGTVRPLPLDPALWQRMNPKLAPKAARAGK